MGGKKKKSLANKLSKMTDEERARYLQHRADMEEEAKRRKEQLIATFLKKKIKKEEAFERLNMAKINQNWHQILRKVKCQEMKKEVEHMRDAIERIIKYKNRTISKLIEELEEAEEQYLNNFQMHETHITAVIDDQQKYMNKLSETYEKDLDNLIEMCTNERNQLIQNANDEKQHLQTILYGQNLQATTSFKNSYETYMQRLYEAETNNKERLENLQKSRNKIAAQLWKSAAALAKKYVANADTRRMHLAELRRLDCVAAEAVDKNVDKIRYEENLIINLQNEYEYLESKRTEQIGNLEVDLRQLNVDFLRVRKELKRDLKIDEKKLKFLIEVSQSTKNYLENILSTGNILRNLSDSCTKLETKREKVCKFLPIIKFEPTENELNEIQKEETQIDADNQKTDDEKILEKSSIILKQFCDSLEPLENFWLVYNKTELDYNELKEERKVLLKENKQLKCMVRSIIEAAVSSKSIPLNNNNNVPSRLPSKIRNAYSAPPLAKILFSTK